MERRWLAPAALAAAVFLCYGGLGIAGLGFYHDDWSLLEQLHFAPDGFWARLKVFAASSAAMQFRPLYAPFYAACHALFGLNPLPWQLLSACVNGLLAWAALRLLERLGAPRWAALVGGLLFLAWPSKDSTLYWTCITVVPASLLAFLCATLAHLRYVETGGPRWAAAATAGLLVSWGFYDQTLFLLPLWLIVPGESLRPPARAWKGFALGLGAEALFMAYKFLAVPKLFGLGYNHPVLVSAENVLRVYAGGISVHLGPELWGYAAKAAWRRVQEAWLLAPLALALPWLSVRLLPAETAGAPAARRLLLWGLGLYVLGYLPIAMSKYVMSPFNHMNRIHLVPALGAVFALLGGMLSLPGRAPRAAACALAGFCLAAHGTFASVWADSWRKQQDIRRLVLGFSRDWPRDKLLLLWQPDIFVERKAPLFLASWDSTGAVRVWLDDPSRRADVLHSDAQLKPEGFASSGRLTPYKDIKVLEVVRGRLLDFRAPDDMAKR